MTREMSRTMMRRRTVLGLLGASLAPAGRVRAAERVSGVDRMALVAGNSAFGLDLYAKLRTTDGNLFYSPYSISDALAMTYAGALGATADEMAKVLRFPLERARLHPAFGDLIREINGAGAKRKCELHTANALWSQKGYPFLPDFQRIAKGSHGAGLEEVDFKRATETARRTINMWVEKQTRDKIKDLLKEGTLDPNTVLVLTNAIYFKGAWMHAFQTGDTAPADFARGARGTVRNVPLMRQVRMHRYLDGDAVQVLELPYEDNEVSMIIVLPRRIDGLGDVEKALTAARVTDWLAKMTPHEVDVALPRFKATSEFRLDRPLSDMGMPLAFSAGRADFSGMVKEQPPVYLSVVVHKAYVDVHEKGTEAAAATGVVARATSAAPPRPRAVFRADHPFFFLIRDNRTESILFVGRLTDPSAT